MVQLVHEVNLMEATLGQKLVDSPKIEMQLHHVVEQGVTEIDKRLDQLTHKWTVGRISKVLLGLVILVGTILGQAVSPWWLILTYLGALCLLQYLLYPTSILERVIKRFGVRTGSEITQEKVALKTLRGDFQEIPTIHRIEDRDAIARMEGEGGITLDDTKKVDVKDAIPQVLEASSIPVNSI